MYNAYFFSFSGDPLYVQLFKNLIFVYPKYNYNLINFYQID